jgi:hypothetical protein
MECAAIGLAVNQFCCARIVAAQLIDKSKLVHRKFSEPPSWLVRLGFLLLRAERACDALIVLLACRAILHGSFPKTKIFNGKIGLAIKKMNRAANWTRQLRTASRLILGKLTNVRLPRRANYPAQVLILQRSLR